MAREARGFEWMLGVCSGDNRGTLSRGHEQPLHSQAPGPHSKFMIPPFKWVNKLGLSKFSLHRGKPVSVKFNPVYISTLKCKPGKVYSGFCRRTNKHKSNHRLVCVTENKACWPYLQYILVVMRVSPCQHWHTCSNWKNKFQRLVCVTENKACWPYLQYILVEIHNSMWDENKHVAKREFAS